MAERRAERSGGQETFGLTNDRGPPLSLQQVVGRAVKLKNTMTKEQAIEELKKAQANGDTECAHGHADDILCKLLAALGYADVVSEYEKVDKWYA